MTAVEWLEKELLKNGYVNKAYYNQDSLNHLENLIEQAKEMEKQQILDAWDNGCEDDGIIDNAKQYYNETYGSKGSDETKVVKFDNYKN